jgi:multicomponent Na+:H+ antiporter subunit F
MFLKMTLAAMMLALAVPLYTAWKDDDIWQTMLSFSSLATKTAVMILVVSVLRDDWMIGMVGVIILCVGNAGLMLLAYILNRIDSP